MKSLIYSIWKGPITSIIGLFLLAIACRGFYLGTLTVLWDGVVLVSAGLALMVTPDQKVKEFVSKFFNALLDKFKGDGPGPGPILPALALLILMSSCGFVKNVTREKVKSHAKVDSVAKTTTNTVEKTTTKITEAIDTAVTIKGSTVSGSTLIKDLFFKPLILQDSAVITVITADSLGRLQAKTTVKDRKVNLHSNRTTETTTEKKTAQVGEVRKRSETETKGKTVDKDVKWRASKALIIVPLIIILLIIILLIITLIKRYGRRVFG